MQGVCQERRWLRRENPNMLYCKQLWDHIKSLQLERTQQRIANCSYRPLSVIAVCNLSAFYCQFYPWSGWQAPVPDHASVSLWPFVTSGFSSHLTIYTLLPKCSIHHTSPLRVLAKVFSNILAVDRCRGIVSQYAILGNSDFASSSEMTSHFSALLKTDASAHPQI